MPAAKCSKLPLNSLDSVTRPGLSVEKMPTVHLAPKRKLNNIKSKPKPKQSPSNLTKLISVLPFMLAFGLLASPLCSLSLTFASHHATSLHCLLSHLCKYHTLKSCFPFTIFKISKIWFILWKCHVRIKSVDFFILYLSAHKSSQVNWFEVARTFVERTKSMYENCKMRVCRASIKSWE